MTTAANLRVAQRISATSKKTFGMFEKALQKAALGRDLIHLELGKPHADTPLPIKEATIAPLRAGQVHYSEIQGSTKLRNAIVAKLESQNGVRTKAENILVTNGLTHAAFATFMAILDPGDEVILLEPYYPQHVGKVELAGGKVVRAMLDAANNYTIDAAEIESKITKRTRIIVLVNPVNPTGRVYTRAELQILADIAIKHDLIVASDEVYEEIVFDGKKHISIASLDGMAERTISMFAFTKSHAMDGWRIGYIAAPSWLMPGLLKITMNDVTHVNTFIQEGAYVAVTGSRTELDALVADDRRKRDLVVGRLNQMPGIRCALPEGTSYAFPDIRETGIPSQTLADMILEKTDVVVEAGSFYGPAGEGHLRVCFGTETIERLDEAMDRLSGFFNAL